ncbi:SpoIIE family protein phosphatase [Streptomyces sp. NPDC059582]|uniref:SpoIIE family protein phosphatase n=1 Tax=Streptomyces sp. NPDC059582 TaxID=3346875 RepID=UPI0036B70A44
MNGRLALLGSVARGLTESEVFRLALQHAVAELSALGGTIHLRGPMSALRLVSATGIPSACIHAWEIIDQDGPLAPAQALQRGTEVWVPMAPAGPGTHAAAPAGSGREHGGVAWLSTGLAALPISSADRSIGVLTVQTGVQGKPTSSQWDFLRGLVAWTEERLAQAPPPVRPPPDDRSSARLRQALKEVSIGSWDWNIETGELIWDEASMGLYGVTPDAFTGKVEDWMRVVHPDDLAYTLAAVERAIRDRSVFDVEYRVRRPDGSWGWTRARAKPTYHETGEPYRMIGMGWDTSESRTARDALSRALRHMSDGFLAVDDDWHVTFANLAAERILGLSEEELFGRVLWELPTTRPAPRLEEQFRTAAREEGPASFDSMLWGSDRLYQVRLVPGPDGRTLYFTDVTETRRLEVEAERSERTASERAVRVAELNAELAKATTSQDVVDAVARRVLSPFGASGLLVRVIEGNRLQNVGAVGHARQFRPALDNRTRVPGDPEWDTITSGTPLFFSSQAEKSKHVPDELLLPEAADEQAWAYLPLTASGRTFGVCMVAFDHPRHLTDDERALLSTISALFAQALERARLYDFEHTRSRALQSSLLPRGLPTLPACTTAARYLPAGQGMDVGGDWYDVIPLSGGQVALVVGDVVGHGLPEAATMGRLRTAVHTLADLELPPDEIMSHLNDIVSGMGEESYVTCIYALYDSTSQVCSMARAGHPPPALVHPDGSVHFPYTSADPPLGVTKMPFEKVEVPVPDGSLLVLYTDGLVESSTREIDAGMTTLARLLGTAHDDGATADLEQLCDRLIDGLLPVDQLTADDSALLVAQLHALPAERIASWPLPDAAPAAGQARRHVREQLAAWDLPDLIPTTELLASELVGNVVRHARGPVRLRLLHSTKLICEVFDASPAMPRIRRSADTDEGGRGLQLITALTQHWGARYTPDGKCIWTEQSLNGPASEQG